MAALPNVTVVMPVRNEGDFITRSLGAVLRQDYPADRLHVIVADGMSTDNTRPLIQALQAEHPNVTLLDNPGKIVSTGLNRALAHAKGEVVVRVDGHCEIAPDYVRRCVAHLQDDGVDVVGGPLETIGGTPLSQVIARAMSSWFGVGGSAFRTVSDRTMLVDTVAFAAFSRNAIERAGAFDEELVRNQDDEYNYRLRKLGAKILLAADVRSRYYSRSRLSQLWRQYFQYGYWKVRVLQKHPRQMRARQFVPPAFVAALAGSALLTPFAKPARALFLTLAACYILANLAASVRVGRDMHTPHAFTLPVVFGTLHISYGSGFLYGLLKFKHRWGDKQDFNERIQQGPGVTAL